MTETTTASIESYLQRLDQVMASDDAAVRQDALADAAAHLEAATADGGDTAAAIAAFGTPEDVADSYREAEIAVREALSGPSAPTPPARRTPVGTFTAALWDGRAWGAVVYMLLALATGIAYFTITVTGLAVSLGLLILIIGVFIALGFIALTRAVSLAEGRLVEGLLGMRMPRRHRYRMGEATWKVRTLDWVKDRRTWTAMLYFVLMLPLGVTYFTVIVIGLATSAFLVATPFLAWGGDALDIAVEPLWPMWAVALHPVAAVVLAIATLNIASAIGAAHSVLAREMLVGGDIAPGSLQPDSRGLGFADRIRYGIAGLLVAIALCGVWAGGMFAAYESIRTESTVSRSFDQDIQSINAEISTGSITVTVDEDATETTVQLDQTYGDLQPDTKIEIVDGTLQIADGCQDTYVFVFSCTVDAVITVPASLDVDLITTTGEIHTTGIDGTIAARTTTGTVNIDGAPTTVIASATTGEINMVLTAVPESVRADTVTGAINVDVPNDATYRVDADTSVGDTSVGVATAPDALSRLTLSVTTGEISVE